MSKPDPSTAETKTPASFLPELEALRGWAILLVFLFHADGVVTGHDRIGTLVSPAQAFMTAGHTGVTLFFILSAFLLARPFLIEGRGGPVVQRRDFYRRRILRIMPLYTATILVAVALSFEKPGVVIDGVRALFFLNSFTGTVASLVPYSAVWWSLATEIQFYLVLPLLGLCLRSKSGRRIGLGILIVWGIGFAIVASQPELFPGDLRFRLSLSLLGRAPAFLAGIAACWLVLQYGDRIRAAARQNAWLRNGGSDALLLVVLFGLGLVLQQVTSLGFIRAEIAAPASRLAESFLWTMVLLLVLLAPLRSRRLITNGASTMLGRFSYSFYLIHEPILFFGLIRLISLGFPLDVDLILRGGIFAIGFLLCLALSAISYHLIERPFLLRKARIDR